MELEVLGFADVCRPSTDAEVYKYSFLSHMVLIHHTIKACEREHNLMMINIERLNDNLAARFICDRYKFKLVPHGFVL